MPKYLLQVKYSRQGIKGLAAQGRSARETAAQELVESVGRPAVGAGGGSSVSTLSSWLPPSRRSSRCTVSCATGPRSSTVGPRA